MKKKERQAVPEYTDWRGNPVRVGTTVLYPRVSGRSVELMEGVVEEIFETREINWDGNWSEWTTPRTSIRPVRSSRFNSQVRWDGKAKRNAIILDKDNVTAVTP